jgi:hypothetical protein
MHQRPAIFRRHQ